VYNKETNMKSTHLFSPKVIEFAKSPLFLGEGRNVARLDLSIETHIVKQTEDAIGKLWFAGDYSPSKDGKDYVTVSKQLSSLFLKNLKFQTVLEVFLPITTNPQLEAWWQQHGFFEGCIHSQSYADIIKAMPVDSKAIFDDIMVNPNIIKRAESILNCFEDTVQHNCRMILKTEDYDKTKHKVSIIKSLFALNILEAILFKSSFLTSFAFKENGIFSVTGDILSKISQDEAGHYAMTINLLNRLRKDPDWAFIFIEYNDDINQLYRDAIEADYEWIDYCYPEDTRMLGVNNAVLKKYVTHNLYSVMTSVQQEPIVEKVSNPCTWANKYSRPSNVQTAQKEKTNGNYMLGIVDTNMSEDDWNNLKEQK